MSKKFDIITMVLMTILVVVLIMVMFNYFTRENDFLAQNSNSQLDLIHTMPSGDLLPNKIDIIDVESGDMPDENEISGDDIISSGDENNQNLQPNDNNIIISGNDNKTPTTPVIMTSDDEISNKEKKEILKELDQTLMELLDVVDKVQTVDESRLTDEESEVQK